MNNHICVDKRIVSLLVIMILLVGIYQYSNNIYDKETQNQKCECPKCSHDQEQVIAVEDRVYTDPVKDYDRRKISDPLEEPTRRVARHNIHPRVLKQVIDYPTRGYPDNFTQVGILIREGDDENSPNENKIMRLFGRQEFPGSTRYNYYTAINSANDSIKVNIDVVGNKELNTDDVITVTELGKDYKVKIHKYDAPRYYPDIF